MLSPLQSYFHYSRGERRGTVVLMIIIVVLISFYFISDVLFSFAGTASPDVQKFQERIASFEDQKKSLSPNDSIQYFMFDPNLIGVHDWIKLGFSQKQAESIENYKASGAEFKVKKDLLKLFMVDEYTYARLAPYIDLPDDYNHQGNKNMMASPENSKVIYAILLKESENPIYEGFDKYEKVYYTKKNGVYQYCILPFEDESEAEKYLIEMNASDGKIITLSSSKGYYPISNKTADLVDSPTSTVKEKLLIDLNTADTTALKKLVGIGPAYANRIVNYREALGGFISLDQLQEVYGLKQETIDKILPNLIISETEIVKIDINKATIDELKTHPYIDWKVANSIVQIRNNYGKFASIDGILKSDLIDDALFQKIKPYIQAK